MKHVRKKRKGVVAFFFIFVFLAILLSVLFAFAIPILIDFNTHLFTAGEIALDDATVWSERINDATVKAQIQATLASSKASLPDQIDTLGFFYQYSWIVIIIAILFVVFMQTRVTVETSMGGGIR